jgi:hypothetical protein
MKKAHQTDLQKAEALLEEAQNLITNVKESLQDDFDSKSEKWQESEKGDDAQDIINCLETMAEELETAYDSLNSITSEFE